MNKIRLFLVLLSVCLSVQFAGAQVKDGVVNKITQGEYKARVHDYAYNADSWAFKGDKNAIIDFSATWCGPCKRLSPILDELAKEYSGKIVFYKVDVDECRELAQTYGVSSVPMLLFCPANGDKPTSITGAYPKDEIVNVINYVFK